ETTDSVSCGTAMRLTAVKLWLPLTLRLTGLRRLRSGGQWAIAEHLDRDGVAEDHALGLNQWPQRLLVLLEGVAAFMGLHGCLVHPGLVQPELVWVVGRAMHSKGEVAPLALFNPARIGQQQLLDGLCLAGLGHHAHKVADCSHDSTSLTC